MEEQNDQVPAFSSERCHRILSAVSSLSPTEITELFKIVHATKCEYSHNNNGIFVNLRWVGDEVIGHIEQFMAFCNKNRIELEKYERLRTLLTQNFKDAQPRETIVNVRQPTTPDAKDASAVAEQEVDADADADADENDARDDVIAQAVAAEIAVKPPAPPGMTTMKFYLLKKKYAKPNNVGARFEQGDLVKEMPVMKKGERV
jgi:hypothetical protein